MLSFYCHCDNFVVVVVIFLIFWVVCIIVVVFRLMHEILLHLIQDNS